MGRRQNNEGSVYKLPDSSWCAAVTVRRGVRKRLRRATMAEAIRARDQLIRERDQQIDLDRKLTVGQLLDEWLEHVKRGSPRPRTWQAYEAVVRLQLKPMLGSARAALLSPREVRKLYDGLLDDGLAAASLVKVRAVLRGALGWAVAEERIPRNVGALVPLPSAAAYEPTRLTVEQAIKVLAAIREHQHGPLWAFMLATGARFGEATGLTLPNLDLDTATAYIEVAAARVPKAFRKPGEPGWELARPKTRRSRRALPVTGFAVAALTRQVALVEAMREAAGARWEEHQLVFPSRRGTPLRNDKVGERWDAILRANALPDIRLHDLRHSLGNLSRRSGTDVRTIQDLLGHASISMTADTYIGEVPEALRAAVERLERLLTEPVATRAAPDAQEVDR